MIRKLLGRLGIAKSVLTLTAASMLLSACLYTALSTLLRSFEVTGIVMSIIAPALVAPLVSYAPMKLLLRLDATERELAQANRELERRVGQRTAELVRANEELQAEIAERIEAEQQAQASLREKDVLLKEVHHRVKNNLQLISSLLYLQSREAQDGSTNRMLQESQNRVHSMALVHERLYQSDSVASVDFSEYVRKLVTSLFRSYGTSTDRVALDLELDDLTLSVDTAIPYGLVINELVSNALRHAFPDGRKGELRLTLRSSGSGCTITIRDDGIGLPADLDVRHAQSLGLQLVNTLVEQLDGTLEILSGEGTAFRMSFGPPGLRKED
jgi:two-component sensor histidine kinase